MKVRFLFVMFTLLGFASLSAQQLSITGKLEPGEILIGEQTRLELKIVTPDLEETHLIVPPDTARMQAEVLSFAIIDTIDLGENLYELTAEMILTSFDSTLVEIPALGVAAAGKEAWSQPQYLRVMLPEVDMEHPDQIKDIKADWVLPCTFREWLLWLWPLWCLLLAIALGYAGYVLYKRRKAYPARKPKPVASPPSPLEVLLEQIKTLSTQVETDSRLFYTRLDDAWRRYLRDSETLPAAMEMTKRSIADALQITDDSLLGRLLERMELAKYARVLYAAEIARQDCLLLSSEAKKMDQTSDNPSNP